MDFNSNTTQQDNSFNYSSPTVCTDKAGSSSKQGLDVLTCVIISISLPLTLLAVYAVFSLIRKDQVAPIYVINLLISDLIQLCCMFRVVLKKENWFYKVFLYMHRMALMASVCFMVCIALERYLVIAWPLWYRHRRTVKISLVVCVVVWTIPLAYILPSIFWVARVTNTLFGVFLLLPYPLLVFFLVGTIKALSAAISVPPKEKRRIVALLVLVLLIYTLILLPSTIWFLIVKDNKCFRLVAFSIYRFSPLADLFLYVFLRKGAVDKLLSSLCCCSKDRNDLSRSTLSTV